MKTKLFRKVILSVSALALSCTMAITGLLPNFARIPNAEAETPATETSLIKDVTGLVSNDLSDYFDESVVQKLPDTVSPNREISVMVQFKTDTLLDGYDALGSTSMTVSDFAVSRQGKSIVSKIETLNKSMQRTLTRSGLEYKLGLTYNTLVGGFEIVIKAGDFAKLQEVVGDSAGVFISEEYAAPKAVEVVENDVTVHETGIFDSTGSKYDGSGIVVAVLDTGLDYTHSAFDPSRFTGKEVITLNDPSSDRNLVELMANNTFTASTITQGLTAADVYLNKKVPYAFDYADGDPDVFPIQESHGTHVSGIMVGNDDTIRGVSPNAQLVSMKVFSDSAVSSKQSWIVGALEDCVLLGVDVINMSLGSGSSFARAVDEAEKMEVYDSLKAHGISLVAAASNDGSAAQGSVKNGSLALTSNPETGTTGSPSTYDSALSVANISGVKTPYIIYNNEAVFFNEARDNAGYPRHFVEEILNENETSKDFTYVVVTGVGDAASYQDFQPGDLDGKIVLVRRGRTNFEEKAQLAKDHGAAGCIIYNNVPGDIFMTVGYTDFPVVSISRDDGEKLVSGSAVNGGRGTLTISRTQLAGPFMETSSSWGPTPDLGIKPEITAHGGEILSAIAGGNYDRYTGTSMASPNQAGVTALVLQYIKETFPKEITSDPVQTSALAYQLMMSTADIARERNDVPFAVRRQGAGLANLAKATSSPAYLRTFVRERYDSRYIYEGPETRTVDTINNKTKVELGDDPDKTGVYNFDFQIVNCTDVLGSDAALTYDVSGYVMSDGIATQETLRGDHTVNEMERILEGATITVTGVTGGTQSGNSVTVQAGQIATVSIEIKLGDEDKDYINNNFENGMYVEGYITLTAKSGTTVDLSVPYLTFFGDWTQAPMMDLEIYDTDRDEQNGLLDEDEKKTLADFIATRPIGGLYGDYISYLGSFAYLSDPYSTTKVYAEKDKIALTNQEGEYGGLNNIYGIWFGLLRNAKHIDLTITEEATGEVIWSTTDWNRYKSFYSSGAHIYSAMDVDFHVREFDLKNNTKYLVKAIGYIDYADGGENTNVKNTFEFPFYTDFEAPIATDIRYYTEYDKDQRVNRLYADISLYDNHYVMGYIAGVIADNENYDPKNSESYRYSTDTFSRYVVPVVGQRNSTSTITIELTNQLDKIKNSHNGHSFMIQTMDYALNMATYEFDIPYEVESIMFPEMQGEDATGVTLNPNETYRLIPEINVSSSTYAWYETLNYTVIEQNVTTVTNKTMADTVVSVVNGQILGVNPGTAIVRATSSAHPDVTGDLMVKVRGPEDDGYVAYDPPVVEMFSLKGYYTNKVYYAMSSDDRDLGVDKAYNDAGDRNFVTVGNAAGYSFSMYPSESIQVVPNIKGFYGDDHYKVTYVSNNPEIVKVDDDGTITALNVDSNGTPQDSIRSTTIKLTLSMLDETTGQYKSTIYSVSLFIAIKNPYKANGSYLLNYYGLGGTVNIPTKLRLKTIYQFAFSNSEYVEKDLSAGDVIDEYDKSSLKQWFIGDDTIERVIVPEGVETIDSYAFANLTELKEIVLPSTLTKINYGAFYGCEKLESVKFGGYPDLRYENGELVLGDFVPCKNNLQFINERGFYNCVNLTSFPFDSIIALGTGAFENAGLMSIELPECAQSLSANAFLNNTSLTTVTMKAAQIKIGANVFAGCIRLSAISINASVIPEGAFDECTSLTSVTLGEAVSVIGQYAFRHTNVSKFYVVPGNNYFETVNNDKGSGNYLMEKGTKKLALVASTVSNFSPDDSSRIEIIGAGAFSTAGSNLTKVNLPNVTVVEDYAFANCSGLSTVTLGKLKSIGAGAFSGSGLTRLPGLANNAQIGRYAFAGSKIANLEIPANVVVGDYAFANNNVMNTVTIGENVKVGAYAFFGNYRLANVNIGNDVSVGEYAFAALSTEEYIALPEIHHTTRFGQYFDSDRTFNYGGFDAPTSVIAFVSSISSVKIGNNVTLGDYAFRGAGSGTYTQRYINEATDAIATITTPGARLEAVTLGTGANIGAYVFYGCRYLTNIDLSEAVAIGDYAFAGVMEECIIFSNSDTPLVVGTIITAPQFASVNLFKAKTLGVGIFVGNEKLTEVDLGTHTEISAEMFSGNKALRSIKGAQLEVVGDYAFAGTALTSVTLKDNAIIGDYAFCNAQKLESVKGLNKAVSIGSHAFSETKLTSADLSAATKIGDMAFENTNITSVVLGEELVELGENPFAGCKLGEFKNDEGKTTYDIGSKVKVIDGVLYRVKKNGLELITYPTEKEGVEFEMARDTIRIGAKAFENAKLMVVTITRNVVAIGDKAFFGDTKLTVVNFRGLTAPRLEEAYDYSYDNDVDEETGLNIYIRDAVGRLELESSNGIRYAGLGFVDYRMWNYSATSVLFGANFVYKITDKAHQNHSLVMVRPSNGTGYENFTYMAYFDAVVDGRAATSDTAEAVMRAIELLPAGSSITENDRDEIYRIYDLYMTLNLADQEYIGSVQYNGQTYYEILMNAKSIVDSIIGEKPPIDKPVDEKPEQNLTWLWIVIGVVAGCVVIVLVVSLRKKSNKDEGENNDDAQTSSENSEEEKSE